MANDNPTFVAGLRSTSSDYHNDDERPRNFREAILWLDPNGMTPITALSAKMKKETTDDPEINWWEEVLDSKRALVTNVAGGQNETLTVENVIGNINTDPAQYRGVPPARQFQVGDIIQIDTASASAVSTDYAANVELAKVTKHCR